MRLDGNALVLGAHVNTDLLHPPAFFDTDSTAAAKGAFAGLDIDRDELGSPPYIILAGDNFGCGSSRESTVRALRAAGLIAVVARSFSHIFARNAMNTAIHVLVGDVTPLGATTGSPVTIDLEAFLVQLHDVAVPVEPPSRLQQSIIEAGGLEAYLLSRNWKW
jgi:3-isopropylmalate dehydratase small subunit